jgi:hypothetical protein
MLSNGRNGRTWKMLSGLSLAGFLPTEVARLLAQKGWLTVADVLSSAIEAEELDNRPTTDLDLPTYIEARLISRGYTTIGSTDALTVRQVVVFFSGLGKGAVEKINGARKRFGKPPLSRH